MERKSEDKNIEVNDQYKIKYFIIGNIIGFLMVLVSVFMGNNNILMALGIIFMGITITIFPFCTPDTVKHLGYTKSKVLGRILGLVLIAVGLWVA